MEKLSSPTSIKTGFGDIKATHKARIINIFDTVGNKRIISEKRYCVEVDGICSEIPGATESVDIIGSNLESLGDNYSIQDIYKKHDEIWASLTKEREDTKLAAAEQLKRNIEATEARLAELKSQA